MNLVVMEHLVVTVIRLNQLSKLLKLTLIHKHKQQSGWLTMLDYPQSFDIANTTRNVPGQLTATTHETVQYSNISYDGDSNITGYDELIQLLVLLKSIAATYDADGKVQTVTVT